MKAEHKPAVKESKMTTTNMTTTNDMRKTVKIFMFVDLQACTRCRGTDANLATALDTVRSVLEAAGVEILVKKTLLDSEQKAMELGFVSSPTIRVNGRDIALQLRESNCASCGEVCGFEGKIDCRVWVYQGQEYAVAPVPMIVDAILSAVYGGHKAKPSTAPKESKAVPENLKRFFAGKAAKQQLECCGSAEQDVCCDAAEKATCCALTGEPETA